MFSTPRRLALTLAAAAGAFLVGAAHDASAAPRNGQRSLTVIDGDRGKVVHHDNDPFDDRVCVVRRVPVMDRFTGEIRIVPKMRCVRGF